MHIITVYTSSYDSTVLISIVSPYFMSENRKRHSVTCVFILLFILVEIVNEMHEIDDVGTNEPIYMISWLNIVSV